MWNLGAELKSRDLPVEMGSKQTALVSQESATSLPSISLPRNSQDSRETCHVAGKYLLV